MDLKLQSVGDGHGDRFVLASYLESAEEEHEPIAVIAQPSMETEPEVLR